MTKKYNIFPHSLVEVLRCPLDGSKLESKYYQFDDCGIKEGKLRCRQCGEIYNIKNGICEIIKEQAVLSDGLMTQEIKSRDQEADRYDKKLDKRLQKELKPVLNYIGSVKGKKIIEYGCGTGRFTKYLAQNCEYMLAIDFSKKSLEILQKKLHDENIKNVGLVLADATKFTTEADYFDLACSFQVIEHIPHKWQRNLWYRNVFNSLKTGGRFISTLYHNDLRRRLRRLPETGFHSDKIFYHYYNKFEIGSEFAGFSDKLKVKFLDLHLPLEARWRFLKFLFIPLSGLAVYIPGLRLLAHLIYIEIVKGKDKMLDRGVGYIYPSFYFKKIWFWFTEPFDGLRADILNFFSYSGVDIQAFKRKKGLTSVIDVTKPREELWNGMRKRFIRKQIEKGERNGIQIKQDFNFKEFFKIYNKFRKNKYIPKDNHKVFPTNGILFSAYYKNDMIAGGVFIADGENMRAWVLASKRLAEVDGRMREVVGQANRMVIWQALKYAHQNGFKVFDLGGINVKSRNTAQRSLNEFKEAFGGKRTICFYYTRINSKLIKYSLKFKNKL